MSIPNGTVIGPYEIVGWLGAGGMGEVYRARDPRLGREVAIKLIPERFATDPSRLHRFEQEARAAGQLNHPNILAVYDVGTYGGSPYIVSELLEGESLRHRLQGGAVPVRKATEYARQIADGLAAAHDKGMVHRDLKPENLFVTAEGRVKILDFGIAKLTRPSNDTARETGLPTETEPGVIVGTVGYMSPEQVRGDAVDARSDLFSLGAVFFEMLTGRPAFRRETSAETMAAILKEDPAGPMGTAVSPALERIVMRCLEKPREARFQSARDLAFGLEVLTGSSSTTLQAMSPAKRRSGLPILMAGALGLSLLAGWLIFARPTPIENPFVNARFSPLTNWEKSSEAGADISPDGRWVTFVADRDGEIRLWSIQVWTGKFNPLTSDAPPPENTKVVRQLGFTGDGANIWHSVFQQRVPLMQMPLTGGTAHPFLVDRSHAPAWSRDGSRLAFFIANKDVDELFVADRLGADARKVQIVPSEDWSGTTGQPIHIHNPVWSTDDEWIYFIHGFVYALNQNDDMDVWRVRPGGGAPERLTRQHSAVTSLAVLDTRTIVYVACAEDGSGPSLWLLDVPTRTRLRLTSGLDRYTSIAASRDGQRLVATVARPAASLWSVPILGRIATNDDATPYRVPSVLRALAPRFGGSSTLFFLSALGTGDGLWRWPVGGTDAVEIWKGAERGLTEPPAASKDGTHVAMLLTQNGRRQLAVMAADGTGLQRLAESIDVQGTVAWWPDGKSILAGGSDKNGPALFRIPVDGGPAQRFAEDDANNPVWCAKDLIVYLGSVAAGQSPLRAVRPDGSRVELPRVLVQPGGFRCLPDGSGIVYLPEVRTQEFRLFDRVTKLSRPIVHLNNQGRLRWFDITPDGKSIVFDRSRENSDIVLIELPKKK